MEKQTEQKETLTKANQTVGETKNKSEKTSSEKNVAHVPDEANSVKVTVAKTKTENGVKEDEGRFLLSRKEAEEYRDFKRRKKVEEIMFAVSKSGAIVTRPDEAHRVCERAVRLKQAAVRVPPALLEAVSAYLAGSKVKMDCVIGGNGETWSKVKKYEARMAARRHVGELTVILSPSMVAGCRYTEIRKELRGIVRAAKKVAVKVWVDKKVSPATLSRLARISCEVGVKYFSVPYFNGCERLRFDLSNGCRLEVSEVENLSDFQKMTGAGVGRIVTTSIWDIYSEWMRDVEKIDFPALASPSNMDGKNITSGSGGPIVGRPGVLLPPMIPTPQGFGGRDGIHAKTGKIGAEVSDFKFL